MSVTLSSSCPKDERNGLGKIAAALSTDPQAGHLVLAVVECSKITTDMDTGDMVPTARIRAVEAFPAGTPMAEQLREMWQEAYDARTGNIPLPLEGVTVTISRGGAEAGDDDE